MGHRFGSATNLAIPFDVATARMAAAGLTAENAHQVIAAMGFTREHALHRCTRRLWSWRDECGNEAFWNAKLGEAAARAGEAGAWPMIADGAWPGGKNA